MFAEAMLERGVHSVTFGGRPREGPMQTVGGIKGSQVLSFDLIAFWAYQLLGDVSKVCSHHSTPCQFLILMCHIVRLYPQCLDCSYNERIYQPSQFLAQG